MEATALAGVLAGAAGVYVRPLHAAANYDEGVYLATMRELRHGVSIGDVFSSQPPGFDWLLEGFGAVSGSLVTIRVLVLCFALLGCIAAWWLGRSLVGAYAGLFPAGLLATAPPWPVNAARLEAETPSTTLAVAALALASRYPAAAGVAFALAVSVKLLALAAAVPLVLIARRRLLPLALGAAAAAAVVLLSVATHIGDVWDNAVAFHLHGRHTDVPGTSANLHRILHFIDFHTPFGLMVVAGIVAAVVLAALRELPWWPLWTWPPAAAAVLVAQRPLLDHHLVLLAAAWAVPAGVTLGGAVRAYRPMWQAAAVAVLLALVAAGLGQQWRQLDPAGLQQPKEVGAAVNTLERLVPPGSIVAGDLQIVPYLAGDRQPPQLVDVSYVRVASGDLSRPEILRDSAGAAAFVVGRELGGDPTLLAALRARYRVRARVGTITIFARPR